jgi:hypothetical protein
MSLRPGLGREKVGSWLEKSELGAKVAVAVSKERQVPTWGDETDRTEK